MVFGLRVVTSTSVTVLICYFLVCTTACVHAGRSSFTYHYTKSELKLDIYSSQVVYSIDISSNDDTYYGDNIVSVA